MSIIENKSDDSSESEDESKGTGVINCITCGKVICNLSFYMHRASLIVIWIVGFSILKV